MANRRDESLDTAHVMYPEPSDASSIADGSTGLLQSFSNEGGIDGQAEPQRGRARSQEIDRDPSDGQVAAIAIDGRTRAGSECAGLLFVINVLRDAGLIDPLLDDPALAQRSSRWILHRLALALVPAEPGDAAVLAFAGLGPHEMPPASEEEMPAADERAALLRHARLCIEHTCARFEDPAGDCFYNVCARHGEIVAEPGWIEIRFPLSTIATDIRRAGLDLDPDYVDWLGLVMKFTYV